MIDLEKYEGLRTALPDEIKRLFRITLCFFKDEEKKQEKVDENFSLKKYIEDNDPALLRLLQSSYTDLKNGNVKIYLGDPDEELEETIDRLEKKAGKKLSITGYLIFNRSAKLGPNDSLPETEEEWNKKAGEFKRTRQIDELFEYMDEKYLDCSLV